VEDVGGSQEERLKRVRSELQLAYTQLKQIGALNSLAEKRLELWRARCRLELAILLIKASGGTDCEDRRKRYIMEGEPQKVLANVLALVADALNSPPTTEVYEVLVKVRRARDLLLLLESKKL
jgi:hypothetical protein